MSEKNSGEKLAHSIDDVLYLEAKATLSLSEQHITIAEYELHRDNHLAQILAYFPDREELKKQIDIKRDYAFGESLFGSREHQAQMQAAVSTYDLVLNLIKDIGGKE